MTEETPKNPITKSKNIAFDDVLDLLHADEYAFKVQHLFRLSGLEGEDHPAFQKAWTSTNPERKAELLEDLEDLVESNTLVDFDEIFRIAMRDKNPNVREIAVRGLWECERPSFLSPIMYLLDDDHATVAGQAAMVLGHYIYLGELGKISRPRLAEIIEKLISIYTNNLTDDNLKRAAIEALGNSGDERIPALIEDAFQQNNSDWVASALTAMGNSVDSRWENHILDQIESDDETIRLQSIIAAGKIESVTANKVLFTYLHDDRDEIRHAAIWALSEIGGGPILDRLEAMLEDEISEEERELIMEAIEQINFNDESIDFNLFEFPPDEETDDNEVEK